MELKNVANSALAEDQDCSRRPRKGGAEEESDDNGEGTTAVVDTAVAVVVSRDRPIVEGVGVSRGSGVGGFVCAGGTVCKRVPMKRRVR